MLCSRSAGCRGCPPLALIASLIPTTVAGHPFWTIEDPAARAQQRIHFLKNSAMLGGLLLVVLDRG